MLLDGGGRRPRRSGLQDVFPLYALVVGGRCLRTFALFEMDDLTRKASLSPGLMCFALLAFSAAAVCALQKPWRGRRRLTALKQHTWVRIAVSALMLALSTRLFTHALFLVGPLRALALENIELLVPTLWAVVRQKRRSLREPRVKGTALMILAFAVLLLTSGGDLSQSQSPSAAATATTPDSPDAPAVIAASGSSGFRADAGADLNEVAKEPSPHDEERRLRRRRLVSANEEVAASATMPDGASMPGSVDINAAVLSAPFVSKWDQCWGTILFVAIAIITCARERLNRGIDTDVGGAKRQHALTLTIAAAFSLPSATWEYMIRWSTTATSVPAPHSVATFGPVHLLFSLAFCAVAVFVVHFYVQALIPARLDNALAAKAALGCSFCCAILADWAWGTGWCSFGVIFCFGAVLSAAHLMTGASKDVEYVLLGAEDYADYGRQNEVEFFAACFGSPRAMSQVRKLMRHILEKKDTRRIFFFLLLNILFMFVEILIGFWTNSLGLIGDAGHMFFDNSALMIGLYANYVTKWHPDKTFTYGYGRGEVLAAFVNSILLCFIAISIVMESVERFVDPPEVHQDYLVSTACWGFVINMIGLFAFHDHAHVGIFAGSQGQNQCTHGHGHDHGHGHGHGHDHGHGHGHGHDHDQSKGQGNGNGHVHGHGHSRSRSHHHENHGHAHGHGHGCNHHNQNLHGVFLHIMADALGSLAVIVSSVLIHYKQWYISDPICSFLTSILIMMSALPLLSDTSKVLLQTFPRELRAQLSKCLAQIRGLDGVHGVRIVHCWRYSSQVLVATVHLQLDDSAHEQRILHKSTAIFRNVMGFTDLAIQLEKRSFLAQQKIEPAPTPCITALVGSQPIMPLTPQPADIVPQASVMQTETVPKPPTCEQASLATLQSEASVAQLPNLQQLQPQKSPQPMQQQTQPSQSQPRPHPLRAQILLSPPLQTPAFTSSDPSANYENVMGQLKQLQSGSMSAHGTHETQKSTL